jgi:hypothetical protein
MSNSAASFVDLINAAYRDVVKAESGALPHALKCGDYLSRAKESVKSEKKLKWSGWLEINCPDISQETASVYMRLDEFKDLIQKKKAKTIAEAREIIREHRQRTRDTSKRDAEKRDDAAEPAGGFDPGAVEPKGPAIENHQLADLGADELSTMLIAHWEDDDLRELAKRINDHLTKKASLFPRSGISSATTNSPPPPQSEPSTSVRRTLGAQS